jgi:catechol 2,3-dioxygenase-like lactoylglutathione lyase family enzyme
MKRIGLAVLLLASGLAHAQTAPGTAPREPGLVVGSGNFFSPIVGDLDRAVAFYRDGLGFEVQGAPADASANPALRDMFGLPDAKLRWLIARAPGIAGGVEIVEISSAGGEPLARRMQDSGAFTLLVLVRDLDSVAARLKTLGAPVLTTGGNPALVPMGAGQARLLMVQDPDGHFVEIVQPPEAPTTAAPANATNIVEVRVRLTVADVEQSLRLYQDALGLELVNRSEFVDNPTVAGALGVPGAQFRFGILRVPTSGLLFEVIDFKGLDRRTVRGDIQDPGSTRIQMRVRDVDAAIAAFARFGGTVVSSGGKPLELPAGDRKLEVAIVREPDNLFVVLIESP